jgi:Flp pilus assembly protein TadG
MRRTIRRLWRDDAGTAALELAGVGAAIIIATMNVAEVGRYAYQSSQVTQAAQAGAQAAMVACNLDHLPATLNCAGLNDAVTQAIQGTQFGTYMQLNGPILEAYYCRNNSGGLTRVAPASDKPTDCSDAADATDTATPTLYLQVNVDAFFQPLFPDVTVARSLPVQITRTAWMRMA